MNDVGDLGQIWEMCNMTVSIIKVRYLPKFFFLTQLCFLAVFIVGIMLLRAW